MPLLAIMLVAALAVGGGVSIVAQNALPDSPLYPVKVTVNETIEGAFSVSNVSRAQWDIHALENRLKEAGALAASGRLSPQARVAIDNNFDAHMYDLSSILAKLRASGDNADVAQIMTNMKAMLTAQQELLAGSSTTFAADIKSSLVPVVAEIQGALSAASVLSDSSTSASTELKVPAK